MSEEDRTNVTGGYTITSMNRAVILIFQSDGRGKQPRLWKARGVDGRIVYTASPKVFRVVLWRKE